MGLLCNSTKQLFCILNPEKFKKKEDPFAAGIPPSKVYLKRQSESGGSGIRLDAQSLFILASALFPLFNLKRGM